MSEDKILEQLSEIELILNELKKYLRIVITIMSGMAGLLLWICFIYHYGPKLKIKSQKIH